MGYGQKVQGEGGFSGAELPEEVAHPYPSGSVTEVEPRGSSWRPPCFTFAPAVARWPRPSPLKPKGTSPAAVEAVRCGTWAGRPAGTVWRSWGAAGGRALRSALHGAARTAPGGRGPAARTHLRPLRPTAPAGVRGRGPSCHGLGRPRSGIRGQSTCGPGGSCRPGCHLPTRTRARCAFITAFYLPVTCVPSSLSVASLQHRWDITQAPLQTSCFNPTTRGNWNPC
ncbi:uncharacterized protein LOC119863958 isoform X5 [Canis lupus familiaris]|uniref:uncharacterized protein LOC119863958 isoform X5 n=1 Tax=Canis lupus familiaris TaxID=9615 RepID=UPI0018F5D524|nr:uncharacterized protein LOC119863958 isoform X5 [Canis lupus familiaris]XP_038430416.1 uncharacterized protein LOC119863958 isoform X4 [Canis lupus familiaris]